MPPATRKSPPQGMARHPPPATLAIVAGLRAPKLSDCTALTLALGEPRLNTDASGSRFRYYVQLAQKPRPRFALKKTHAARITSRITSGAARGRGRVTWRAFFL